MVWSSHSAENVVSPLSPLFPYPCPTKDLSLEYVNSFLLSLSVLLYMSLSFYWMCISVHFLTYLFCASIKEIC